MAKDILQKICETKTSRRGFILGSAAGCAALLAADADLAGLIEKARAGALTPEDEYMLNKAENTIYTNCLNCNTGCGIKAKFLDGVLVKIDGNPYSPWTLNPHLSMATGIRTAETVDGAICPKGQAGIQIYYDPYRIRKVLKRAGKRGENKWVTIPFDQAIDEIVNGGKLFAKVPGEENRHVEGLKDLWALRDPKVAKEMSDFVDKIRVEKDKAKKQALVKEFQAKFKDTLQVMIDPEHPDLGPKNNQFVFWWGRLKDGRGDLIKRFTLDSFGSINAHGHTTVCQGSLYFTGKAMSEQWTYDPKKNAMTWTGGDKFYWQAELERARFVIFVGANLFEGNYGPPLRAQKITKGLDTGRLKYAVIDPVYRKVASKAWKWVPVTPGRDTAIAMGMIRTIIENKRYDAKYLACANKAAAKAAGEPTWTNACWLLKIVDGRPTVFVRAHELGFTPEVKEKDGKTYVNEKFVVIRDGQPVEVDPNDETTPVYGDLLVDTEISGIRLKSVLQVLYEEAAARSLEEWAQEAGVQAADIADLAREFTSYGKQAVVDIHRGVSQHTSGYYNVQAWNVLNLLIGNYDYSFIKVSTYSHKGDKPGQAFNIGSHPKKLPQFGTSIIRHGVKYEDSTIFNGYPAKRPWFPLASDIYQEVLPSVGDMYPYQVKALILYMGSPVYSLSATQGIIDVLQDVNKLPLFIASDITVGETSMYADYIFPDLTYLERWEFQGSHPSVPFKVGPIRQPAAKPLTETVKVFGQEMPLSLEALVLGIAEKLGLPGFGPDGFGPGKPLTHADHLYLKQVANLATDGKPVPDADDEEVRVFMEARKHLPKSVFDADRWQAACGEAYWRKVIYLLNRGGRFDDWSAAWDGDKVKNKYGKYINMYCEKTATTKNAMNGKNFSGLPLYIPDITDCTGKPINDEKDGFDLRLLTGRVIQHTKSRTAVCYWLQALNPENSVDISPVDAQRLGLKAGDTVKIVSPTNPDGVWKLGPLGARPVTGKVRIIEGIRPGCINFSLGSGHWAYGAGDITIDGTVIKGDPRRGTGIHANVAMRVDPVLKNTSLEDMVGASVVVYDTKVKLVKV
ncbi:molydopterin dinucleotide-binding region [Thermosinus carboxydivorans Nor1]|uniref:Molydopterin dinucleotide-binding region n=1 Tax=Thermosinus carboxydivorans Nor1 TaxID=401526 RepID=A1HU05_9FIRM|nr:molybdopterin-dependent oxidoreductase [Thermosinus carboxydivorans]EAX46479.1 molydopterin dinucleotide-binding region [Thermosinus carboxydivorans Nor1]